ncbi:PREDICTED: exosome complex component RRP45-like [Branchiostoma belcheri]|uniref:Exosome complex component RRP45 n=1 Tax=Branchiostoma belcheri TaxID=7741 RepID=A0A6P4XYJ3_BRABE|nr:PREDICTED: exosome complex component RRP45-like [Branchiostoma belcheri]
MKEVPMSTCEREFILSAIRDRKRIDGRQTYDYRRLKVAFGMERGCCIVELGDTKVLAQVSGKIEQPKKNRPTEGSIIINLELSPMASPAFEPGRPTESGIEMNRILERNIRDSRAVDTESLCIVAGEKVWCIRADIHVLNDEGNIMDAASIAAITALSHFRRPDVSVMGEEVTVHSPEDRDPVPLSVHHMPVCVTFAFFDQGEFLLVDPTRSEERVMNGRMVVGMNMHREICTLMMSGGMLLVKEQVLRCSQIATVKVAEIIELIQKALDKDAQARQAGEKCGFAESVPSNKITTNKKEPTSVDTTAAAQHASQVIQEAGPVDKPVSNMLVQAPGTVQIGEGLVNTWQVDDEDMESEEDSTKKTATNGREAVAVSKPTERKRPVKTVSHAEDSGSEEEEKVVLYQGDVEMKSTEEPDATTLKQPTSSNSDKPAKKKGKKKKAAQK